jgi:tetratricopeptide (TPR) repeat protein
LVADAKAIGTDRARWAFMERGDIEASARFRGSFSGYERNTLFVRTGGRYVQSGYAWGLDFDHDGRAVAPLDMDGDGDLDLAILGLQGLKMLRNELPAGASLRLRLRAKTGPAQALGATVIVRAEGRESLHRVALTEGFHTQVWPELHLGLGGAREAAVEIRWPSGAVERVTLAADARWQVSEGAAPVQLPLPAWPKEAAPRGRRSLDLRAPVRVGDREEPLSPGGRPTVVNFWASWCAACKTELPALTALARAQGEQVNFRFVSVDRDLAKARAMQIELGLPSLVRATDRLMESFFPDGKVSLPATLVFDAAGRLRRTFYRELGGPELATLLRDLREARPTAEDLVALAEAAAEGGDANRAYELLERADALSDDPTVLLALARMAVQVGELDRGLAVLRRVVAATPDDGMAWLALGQLHAKLGDRAAARQSLERALRHAPRSAMVHNALGNITAEEDQLDRALEHWARALEYEPAYMVPYQNILRAHLKRGDKAAVMETLRRNGDPQGDAVSRALHDERTRPSQISGGGEVTPGPPTVGRAALSGPRDRCM